jgi:dipeptidyl aminopeptidase/acylaminoacyl peptidase
MKNVVIALFVLLSLSAQTGKKTESFWNKLLRITGISATPGALRGEEETASGDVWLAQLDRQPALRRLTQEGGYTSPVFDKDANVLALKANDLYRLSTSGAPPVKLRAIPKAVKLVGISRDEPDRLLVVVKDAQALPQAAMFSLRDGALAVLHHDARSTDDRTLLAHLLGWERVYGDTRVYVVSNEKAGAGDTTIKFRDVWLQRGSSTAINLTNGNGVSSGQPSLSADGRQVVFIRGGR